MFTISTGTRRVLPNRIVPALVSWDISTCSMPSEPEKKHTMPIAMPCLQDSDLAKENRRTELATSKKDQWWDYNVWLAILNVTLFGDYKQIHVRLHEKTTLWSIELHYFMCWIWRREELLKMMGCGGKATARDVGYAIVNQSMGVTQVPRLLCW